jgi:hypothetical protein
MFQYSPTDVAPKKTAENSIVFAYLKHRIMKFQFLLSDKYQYSRVLENSSSMQYFVKKKAELFNKIMSEVKISGSLRRATELSILYLIRVKYFETWQ